MGLEPAPLVYIVRRHRLLGEGRDVRAQQVSKLGRSAEAQHNQGQVKVALVVSYAGNV